MQSAKDSDGIVYNVGDGVSWSAGTDTDCGTITRISENGRTIYVVEDKAELLNGFNSGESDELKFYPGGFAGPTEGNQRYKFSPGSGPERAFTLRHTGSFKLTGTSTRGSMASWGVLYPGRHKHYDYNF